MMADQTPEQRATVQREVRNQMVTLLISGLGLVAALAWNEAVLGLFRELFPQGGGLVYKFGYAVVVTAIVVSISIQLRKFANK